MALAPLIVTGVLIPAPLKGIGFAVSTIPGTRLESSAPYIVEALRELPGTFVDEATGPAGPTIIRLRGGEEVFTQVLIDGVQVNQNGGFFDFQGLALSNVDRIEVARGPQSATHGSSAVSGVLQLLTPRGRPGRPAWSASLEGGDALGFGGTGRATGSIAGGSDKVQYSGGAGAAYNRGIYRLPHDAWTHDASLRLDLAPDAAWHVTGMVRFASVDSKQPVRDAGATRVPLDPTARNARQRLLSSVTATRAGERWIHRFTGTLYRDDFTYEDRMDGVAAAGTLPFFVPDFTFEFNSVLWRPALNYTASVRLGSPAEGRGANLSYGARWEREKVTDRTAGDFGEGTLPLDRNSVAAFAELQVNPAGPIHLLAGSRAERFEGLAPSVTPRVSALIEAVPGNLTLRVAAGTAYKAPNLQQQYLDNPFIISNPDLSPETSTSWEVGINVHTRAESAGFAVTYFRQQFRDLIRTVQFDATRQINRNLGASRSEGLELEARYDFAEGWTVGATGTWLSTAVLDNAGLSTAEYPVGEPLPFRPSATASGFVAWRVTPRLSGTVRGTYTGEQIVLSERFSGNRVAIPGYVLLGATANLQLSARWGLYGRFDNLLDVHYETAFDRPGIPLTAAIGVRLRG